MPVTLICPNCDARLSAPDTVLGKKIRCKKCDELFVAKRPSRMDEVDEDDDRIAPSGRAARGRRDEDEDDDRSRKPASRRRDDEPRPRGKKKGKAGKKQGGVPVLAAVLVIGAVVLIGGGVAVYFLFIKEDKPVDTPVAAADGTGGPKAKGMPGPPRPIVWVDFTAPDGSFTAKFPQQPVRKTRQVQTQFGPVQIDDYMADTGAIRANVGHSGAPGGGAIDGVSLEEIERLLDNICNLIAREMNGGREVSRKPIDQDGRPGREMVIEFSEGGGALCRLFVGKGRLWMLTYECKPTKPDKEMVDKFYQGFELK